MQFNSAITEEQSNTGWILRAVAGAVIGGILSGLFWAGLIIFRDGWFSLRVLVLMGAFMGFIVGAITAKLAGRKSAVVGIIAVIGCAAAVLAGKYTLIYWYSRDFITSPFDFELIRYIVSTPEVWQIEDAVWFVVPSIVAWLTAARETQQTTPTVAPSATNNQ
jgi:hypothetical protein